MRTINILTVLAVAATLRLGAQTLLPVDSVNLRGISDFLADDYGNTYLYRNSDFSLTKYNAAGRRAAKLMLTVPYRVQDVQNPLNIFLFSQNAQQIKILDRNLVEIQTVDLRENFAFVAAAYVEDLQQVWLLDGVQRKLVQYSYRDGKVLNAFPMDLNFEDVVDFIVFDKKLFLLSRSAFRVYTLDGRTACQAELSGGRRLRRENSEIFIIKNNEILKYSGESPPVSVFNAASGAFVEKNSASYFVMQDSKLYLYPLKKQAEKF